MGERDRSNSSSLKSDDEERKKRKRRRRSRDEERKKRKRSRSRDSHHKKKKDKRERSKERRDGRDSARSPNKARSRSKSKGRSASPEDGKKRERRHANGRKGRLERSESRDRHQTSSSRTSGEGDQKHFKGGKGTKLNGSRYEVLRTLGEGTFAKVVECNDITTIGPPVAIKVIRAEKRYAESAEEELRMLRDIEKEDKSGRYNCVRVLDVFYEEGSYSTPHTCIVFPQYGPSLYAFLERNKFKPFTVDSLRAFAYHLTRCLRFLHSLRIIHTDLKPENILLKDPRFLRYSDGYMCPLSNDIVVIDFGSAQYDHEPKSDTIQTRHYRAPEVVLGLGWSMPADMWSLGCILVELLTGECMFRTHDSLEHLAMMERVVGPIPKPILSRCGRDAADSFLSRDKSRLRWPTSRTSRGDEEFVSTLPTLETDCSKMYDRLARRNEFLELVRGMLTYDPDKRLTAKKALDEPFLRVQHW